MVRRSCSRPSVEAEIGRLLHPQISEFFLFDGELLKEFYDRLNTDRERISLRGSIDTVLGIPALQLAERDVSELATDALQRQTKAIRNVNERDRVNRQLRGLKNQQKSVEKDRQEIQEALHKAEVQLREVKEQFGAVAELQADAREQETLEASIEGANKRKPGSARTCGSCLQADGGRQPPLSCSKRSKRYRRKTTPHRTDSEPFRRRTSA